MDFSTLPAPSFEEANEWLAGKAGKVQTEAEIALEVIPEEYIDIRLHEGNLEADNLDLTADCLIINGNLTIKGLLQSAQEGEYCSLIVLGDVFVDRYLSWNTQTVISGNLHARHIATNSLNNFSFDVGGDVNVVSFAEFGEYAHIRGNLTAGLLLNLCNQIKVDGSRTVQTTYAPRATDAEEKKAAHPAFILRSEALAPNDGMGGIDEEAYRKLLENNLSPFLE